MTTQISRRRIAQGSAWAVPAVALASAAPAATASTPPEITTGSICSMHYGAGTINYQTHSVTLGMTNSSGVIPAGTTVSWTVTMSGGAAGTGGTNEVPMLEYSPSNQYTLTTSLPEGTATNSFVVTLTANEDIASPWCAPRFIWNDTYSLRPGATVNITSGDSEGGTAGSLSYVAAKRYPSSINSAGRAPHNYLSRTGLQTCYPSIQYTRILSRDGYDNVTCYNGTSCSPAPGAVNAAQYVQPAVC